LGGVSLLSPSFARASAAAAGVLPRLMSVL